MPANNTAAHAAGSPLDRRWPSLGEEAFLPLLNFCLRNYSEVVVSATFVHEEEGNSIQPSTSSHLPPYTRTPTQTQTHTPYLGGVLECFHKRVNTADPRQLPLEKPAWEAEPWLASWNLDIGRAPTIPRTNKKGSPYVNRANNVV